MESEIYKRLKLRYLPVAILFTNEKPPGALEYAEGSSGCIVAMLKATAKGRQAVFSRSNYGCWAAGIGLGFLNRQDIPDDFMYTMSTGKKEEKACQSTSELEIEGGAFKKTPELAKTVLDVLPFTNVPYQYVVFKPLTEIDPSKEEPKIIVFYANPDQLSALVLLANYGRPGTTNVIIPFGAGCQSICLLPLHEASQGRPQAVVGMTDITARAIVDADLLTFSTPYAMFREMEENVPGSFLDKPAWQKVAARIL
jgi:uncharacterized protein (DUF169 family)